MAFIISSLEEDKDSFQYWLLSLPGGCSRRLAWVRSLWFSFFMPFWWLILCFFHLWLSICSIVFRNFIRIILNTWCLRLLLILITLLLLLLLFLFLLLLLFLFLFFLFFWRLLLLLIFLLLFGLWFFLICLILNIFLFLRFFFIRTNTLISNYFLFLFPKSFTTFFFPLILSDILYHFLFNSCHLLNLNCLFAFLPFPNL